MLPSLVAHQIITGIRRQLSRQFPAVGDGFTNGDGEAAIDRLTREDGKVFKGPYLSLGLPFQRAADRSSMPFANFDVDFDPYVHQLRVFQRLAGAQPQPTLVATGTGSGKTECFLYPILDHCGQHPEPGIKAIVIYPMNALATDQARRFAREIHRRDHLRERVRVGLFTGDADATRHKRMTEDWVITCKDTQRADPPDILLTNYKMLDFLLIRPQDRGLWQHNAPGRLRFLVVDELHTFDGAQGTDLACLIRRLRDRLQAGDELACVGTSATLGGENAAGQLVEYASKVFNTPFDADSVLGETRESVDAFLEGLDMPEDDSAESSGPAGVGDGASAEAWVADRSAYASAEALPVRPDRNDDESHEGAALIEQLTRGSTAPGEAARALANYFLGEDLPDLCAEAPEAQQRARLQLGMLLGQSLPFRSLIQRVTGVADCRELAAQWAPGLASRPAEALAELMAFLALVSHARHADRDADGLPIRVRSLVDVRVQVWIRELRRVVASVGSEPTLEFADDLPSRQPAVHLPVAHCQDCHATGWIGVRKPSRPQLITDLATIYNSFFNGSRDTALLFPVDRDGVSDGLALRSRSLRVCGRCAWVNGADAEICEGCGAEADAMVGVIQPDTNQEHTEDGARTVRFHRNCPFCGSKESLFVLGSRAASLSAVAIEQLFGSAANTDRKLIAFSDSVQDAAHRAGFFEARTFREVMRKATAGLVAQLAAEGASPPSLAQVLERIGPFWRERFPPDPTGDGAFAATFLPPDLEWLQDYEALKETGELPPGSNLVPSIVIPRMGWEVLSEFGLRSRVGRSLEREHEACAMVSREPLAEAVKRAAYGLREEIGELRDLPEQKVAHFLLGLLWRMRVQGAFRHPDLRPYVQSAGKPFLIGRQLHLPSVGPRSRLPVFLTMRRLGRTFDHIVGSGTTWYAAWFSKTLASEAVFASASLEQGYEIALRALVANHLVDEEFVAPHVVWMLRPDMWQVSRQVQDFVCDSCGHAVQASTTSAEAWEGMPCLRASCPGQLEPREPLADEGVMASGLPRLTPPVRLVAEEHTGLLDPQTRERVERSFKNGHQPWDVNLLSATPTMEMGVDIGDLSSVLLCSVPPAQARYLQRIGRAGRRDGNALSLTIANGQPHDLYFYADPLEMMAGDVRPPGVFLQAGAVLERQLLAYCFDQWTQAGAADDAIPPQLKTVLDAVERDDQAAFPFTLLDYVREHRNELLDGFRRLFDHIDDATFARLEARLFGDVDSSGATLGWTVTNRLRELVRQRGHYSTDIDRLRREMKRLEGQPEDEATKELLQDLFRERTALLDLRKRLNSQYTLSFFTDEGLLPNYAFPEEGVQLKTVLIRRRDAADKDSDYERLSFEVYRPAQAALSELAPTNRYYGNGRQVQIDQVELRESDLEAWRMCDRCHYAEKVTVSDEHPRCPRCSSHGWVNVSQRHELLRLKRVYATAMDRDSRIGDDADQREPVFFQRQLLVDIAPEDTENARVLQDETFPFGFEYVRRAVFREVNFGEVSGEGMELTVADDTRRRPGFQVCRHCGKVRMWRPRKQDQHTFNCPARDKPPQEQQEDYVSSLYLYRELQSEAIRILLPMVAVAQSEVQLQSFIAALRLGLQRYYRGDVDHIHASSYSEPVDSGANRRFYLVLMDNVPGGTGYLKELMVSPDRFRRVLEEARNVLAECSCRDDEDRDGCYRCLFAYRQTRDLDQVSRSAALGFLDRVLERWDTLGDVDRLDRTNVNVLHDSVLETLAEEAIGNERGVRLRRARVGTRPGAEITVKRNPEVAESAVLRWTLEPQVDLGPQDGVAVACRPDFVLRCLSPAVTAKPVAVFTDGFEVHADKVADDTRKRFAVLRSGEYLVWSLSWNDLPGTNGEIPGTQWLNHPESGQGFELYQKLAPALGRGSFQQLTPEQGKGSFAWLIDYMRNPEDTAQQLRQLADSRVCAMLFRDDEAGVVESLPLGWHGALGEASLAGHGKLRDEVLISFVASVPNRSFTSGSSAAFADAALCLVLGDGNVHADGYRRAWETFLTACNLYQFLPRFLPASTTGLAQDQYDDLLAVSPDAPAAVAAEDGRVALNPEWEDAIRLTTASEALRTLAQDISTPPEIGYELMADDADSGVLAELEWGWELPQCGLALGLEPEEQRQVEALGWRLVHGTDDGALAQLRDWLRE